MSTTRTVLGHITDSHRVFYRSVAEAGLVGRHRAWAQRVAEQSVPSSASGRRLQRRIQNLHGRAPAHAEAIWTLVVHYRRWEIEHYRRLVWLPDASEPRV